MDTQGQSGRGQADPQVRKASAWAQLALCRSQQAGIACRGLASLSLEPLHLQDLAQNPLHIFIHLALDGV